MRSGSDGSSRPPTYSMCWGTEADGGGGTTRSLRAGDGTGTGGAAGCSAPGADDGAGGGLGSGRQVRRASALLSRCWRRATGQRARSSWVA